METLALCEVLKLLFNITHHFPETTSLLTASLPAILDILIREPLSNPALQPPVSLLLNALMNFKLDSTSAGPLMPAEDPTAPVEHLSSILSASITTSSFGTSESDTNLVPLLTLLSQLYPIAKPQIQQTMRRKLLPSAVDRSQPLGKGDSLPARLLRLSTSAVSISLKEPLSNLLFALSDEDPGKFVENVGFGFAAGYLQNHNIPVPTQRNDPSLGNRQHSTREAGINFVTGQNLADEPEVELTDMTEDEKMREAERLFVLFERLKKTGVIDVRNPVEEAMRSGRFEEVDD